MYSRQTKHLRADRASLALMLVWAIAVSLPLTFLMASHSLPLPITIPAQIVTNTVSADTRWQAEHILVADCPCSEFVADYLIERGARPELHETVWLLGGSATWEEKIKSSGFAVQHLDAETVAAHYGIQGGPWLRLISPTGVLAYSGGYAPKRARSTTDICDLNLWHSVAQGATVTPYPAFGCASSSWLRKTLDPLGMKYGAAK